MSAGTVGHLESSAASKHSSDEGWWRGVGLAGDESLSSVTSCTSLSSCIKQIGAVSKGNQRKKGAWSIVTWLWSKFSMGMEVRLEVAVAAKALTVLAWSAKPGLFVGEVSGVMGCSGR